MQKLVFSFTYLIAQCPGHITCRFMSASANCCLASELYALRTVQCCHIALRIVVTVKRSDSDYSSDMHTAGHLQHTFTVTTGAGIERRPTGDPPHSTQFLVLTAEPQFGCTGTHSLLQTARFTASYSTQERHSCTK